MPAKRYIIFISSVQKELATERRAVKDFISHDPLLRRYISDVFLFEDIPAGDRKPDDIYLDQVEQCDIYLAILGNKYGWLNDDGKSPTELEFEQATKTHRERLVFVKGNDDKAREPGMRKLVNSAGRQVTRRRFSDTPGLIRKVYASLVECLDNRGDLRSTPFDDSVCDEATLRDIHKAEVTDMIADCRKAGLPEPDFEQCGPHFVVTLWRDWLTETAIDMLKLNERQKKAIFFIKQNGSITNKQYQKLTKITDRTALRDIKELINKKVLHKIGTTGRATHYVVRNKPDINPTNPT